MPFLVSYHWTENYRSLGESHISKGFDSYIFGTRPSHKDLLDLHSRIIQVNRHIVKITFLSVSELADQDSQQTDAEARAELNADPQDEEGNSA